MHEEWLIWMKDHYIPLVMNSGFFTGKKLLQLMNEEDNGGTTYALQLFLKDIESFNFYMENHFPKHHQLFHEKYQNNYVDFQTVLKVVDLEN